MSHVIGQLKEGASFVKIIQRYHLLIQDVICANPIYGLFFFFKQPVCSEVYAMLEWSV